MDGIHKSGVNNFYTGYIPQKKKFAMGYSPLSFLNRLNPFFHLFQKFKKLLILLKPHFQSFKLSKNILLRQDPYPGRIEP